MARVVLTERELVVEVEGIDKVFALKSRLVIVLDHVRGATADPGIAREWKGPHAPGALLPGVIVAGTFHHQGERVFWDVRNPANAIVIELDHEKYRRLVIGVDDPAATVAAIEAALDRRS